MITRTNSVREGDWTDSAAEVHFWMNLVGAGCVWFPVLGGKRGGMSREKDVVVRYVEVFNRGNVEGVIAEFSAAAQIWGVMGWGTPAQARPLWTELMQGLEPKLELMGMVQEGTTVAARYTERGRSARAFRGMEPTGKTYEVLAMEWFEFEGEKIVRRWGARDFSAIARQLGFGG